MKKLFWFFVVFWLVFGFGIGASYAEWQARIRWDPNSEIDLRCYTVYVGLGSRDYYTGYEVNFGDYVGYTIPEIFEDGVMHYFAVTASNWSGHESGYSNEVRDDGSGPPDDPPDPPSCYIEVIRIE